MHTLPFQTSDATLGRHAALKLLYRLSLYMVAVCEISGVSSMALLFICYQDHPNFYFYLAITMLATFVALVVSIGLWKRVFEDTRKRDSFEKVFWIRTRSVDHLDSYSIGGMHRDLSDFYGGNWSSDLDLKCDATEVQLTVAESDEGKSNVGNANYVDLDDEIIDGNSGFQVFPTFGKHGIPTNQVHNE